MEASARKRAEEAEQRRNEADERRYRQGLSVDACFTRRLLCCPELLIDVTSHELRQPVSAILNCSSYVKSNLINLREQLQDTTLSSLSFHLTDALREDLDNNIQSLDAIYQVSHLN
jgi:hypothetical protein